MARLGCAILLVVALIAAYLTRGRWMDKLPWRAAHTDTSSTVGPVDDGWMPLSEAGAGRARGALKKLSASGGPAYLTVGGSDVASYIFLQIVKQMPASSDSFAAKVDGDHIRLRARMKTSELGGTITSILGKLIGDRERVEMGGTLRVLGKGQAEFRVDDVKVHDVSLPNSLITQLVRSVVRGPRPAGLTENGLPIAIPSYIGDVRIADGRITLYKNAP
jgi:hypothetical protein